MGDLNRIREAFPDLDKYNYSDSEVINWMAGRLGENPQELGVEYGVIDPEQGDLSRGFEAGVDSTKALVSGAAGIAGDTLGFEGMRDAGIRGYQRNMADIGLNSRPTDNAENVGSLGGAADFAQYYLGYAAPQIAEAALSGGVGSILGKQVVKQGVRRRAGSEVAERALRREAGQDLLQTAGRRGGLAAMGTQAVGTETGAIYGDAAQRALDEGRSLDTVDTGRAALGGLAAGALEFGADVATLGLARVGPAKGVMDLLSTRSRTANAGIRATTGAVAEGTTEVLQTGIEDVGAGTALADANFSDPTSFFAGAVGGGAIGGAGGLVSPTPSGSEVNTVDAMAVAEEDAQLEAQALAEQQAEGLRVQAEAETTARIRREAAATFTPRKQFAAERQKLINDQLQADIRNPETELGKAFEVNLNEKGIFDPSDVEAEAKAFLQGYQKEGKAATDAQITEEYIAALDVHAEAVARGEVPTPQAIQEVEGDTATDAAPQENVAAPTKKPTKKEQLRADAVEKLGEDFEQNHPELSQLLGEYKYPRFQRMLDKAVAEKGAETQVAETPVEQAPTDAEQAATPATQEDTATPPVVATEQPAAETTSSAFLNDSEVRAELKPQQQKVYDAVLKAANDNTLGDLFSVTFESGDTNTQSKPKENTPTPGSVIKARRAAQRKILKGAGVKEKTILDVFKTKKAEPSAADVSKFASVGGVTSQAQPRKQAEQVSILEAAGVSSDIITLFKEAAGKQPRKKAPKERGFKVEADNALLKSLSGITNQRSAATATSAVVSKLREKYGNDGLREMLIRSGVDMSGGIEVADTATANDLLAEGGAATTTIASAGGSQSASASSKTASKAKAAETKLMKAAGMSDADIKSFYDIESAVPELAETDDADAAATTRAAEEASLKATSSMLAQSWDSSASRRNAPLFADLTMDQKIDWMHYSNAADASNAIDRFDVLDKQQREIERAATSGTETQNEQVSEPQTEERNAEERDTGVGESESGGSSPEPASNADTGLTPQEPSTEAEDVAQETDTGVVGEAKAAPKVEVKKRKKIDPKKAKMSNPRFGVQDATTATASREVFEESVNALTGDTQNVRIHVFDNEADALAAIESGDVPSVDVDEVTRVQPYGWVQEDDAGIPHAHFILDRIPEGGERAAFMHEVGSHVGIDSVLDEASRTQLASQIADWADAKDGSLENKIALRALGRMDFAAMRGGVSDGVVVSEAIAYFLEEATLAGVDPSAKSALGNFVQRIYDAFTAAFEALGLGGASTLSAQDLVDMAYGAARFELMERSQVDNTAEFQSPSGNAVRYGVAKREWVRSNLGGAGAVRAYDTASGVAAKAALSLKFVHNIVRDNRESMPALGRWYDAMLQVEATRNEIRQSYQGIKKQARALSSERRVAVNKFLGSSTFDQQWGYDPKEYHPDLFVEKKVEVNAEKRIQFRRMSDTEKQLIADIFAHGERMRQRKVALAKKLGVAGKFFTDASLEGPYAPLKRFGNYIAELKSTALVEAGRAAKADGATKKQKDAYEKLKSDRNHYVISFFDTEGAANQFVDENKKNYAFSPPATERTPNIDKERVSNPDVYEKVMGALAASTDSSMDANAKTAFREMVKSMYFQSMDERSARTSGAKRLNRAGYEENMLRSFEGHADAEASLIAQMENGTEVNTALAQAGKETRVDPNDSESNRDADKQRVFNNIAKHYATTLVRNETPVQDMVSTGNSVYMLLTSVGYHLTNATQPVMVSIPRIAGDFGGYAGAWSAMFRGYKYSRAAAKIGLNMETEIDLDKVPPEYRKLLKLLQDRNLIDQGMEEDGSFNRFNTGSEVLNRGSDILGTITGKLYNVAKFVEAQNRISTAIAAYDAARANSSKLAAMKMTPEQYATAVVEDTQGNFSQLDAPSLIKSLPKVVTQYRKYQLLMAWHYASAYKQIRWGSPEEKAAGARVLAYSVGHAAIGAGATGVPLITTAFWLATFLGDEDEPQDMERWIKENIDDGAFGQALSRGVFSTLGLDLSTKLNQSKIFHPLPYVDFESGEEGARNIIMGAVGPAGTTGVNFFRAAEYFKQGDLLKGIEYSMPKGIRSVAESYRLATEGMTTKSGTIVVDPREFDVGSLLINAMGLPASEINRLKWTKGQQYELEQYFSKEGGKIRKNYIEATRKRDRDAQAELRQEFRDLQKAKDRVRPFFNDAPGVLNRQSISTLLRAPRNKDRLEQREQEKLR